ncbi:hypothetical protein BP5796_02458 [Coleophoma crateriformis]|uniref:Uncharacterized protein n=1 Tax=Coleophoma crateriformis TaxID=565419 RepID=A0A3D8SY97_9HELO|nr:hypothetical protein BP5796_02458 [Coleophoma crateriformis]
MGRRSNTAPLELQDQPNGNSALKFPTRSATVIEATKSPNTKSHNHHLKFLHSPNPFTHHDPTPPPSSRPSNAGPRPGLPQRQNSVRTRYIDMLLNLDDIPRLHNILASAFTWILLAGFLIFPGTFTSISAQIQEENQQAAAAFLATVKNVQLLIIGGACSGIGAAGMVWLWWRWRRNYVWLLNRIFLPGCLNSLAGLISTLISVYAQQQSQWSITARVTAAVTGGIMVVTGVLFIIYNFAVLSRVKSKHKREMADEHEGETVREKLQRQAMEPALEPGSVV